MQAGGGTILIPCDTYQIEGTITIDDTYGDHGIIIRGTSEGTELAQQSASPLFQVSNLTSGAGVRFEDLHLNYNTDLATTGTAISVSNSSNVMCQHVYFANCPTAFADDSDCEQCGLFGCTIFYDGDDGATMVSLSGSEAFVHNSELFQTPQGGTNDGPTNCNGVVINSGSAIVTNCHISDYDMGIKVLGCDPLGVRLSNILSQCWTTSLSIEPATEGGTILNVTCDNCIFALSGGSSGTGPGILVDTNGGPNSAVSNILLTNCMSYGWSSAGLQIKKGANIVVNGGRFGSCNPAGIVIADTASNVVIDGADCSGKVPNYTKSLYGISILAAVQGAYISNCNLTNTTTAPIQLSSAGAAIEITKCAGYNDIGTVVSSTAPTSGSAFSAASLGYFGPVVFYATSSGSSIIDQITLSGKNTNLESGCFRLGTGTASTAAITYHGIAGTHPWFLMIGQ